MRTNRWAVGSAIGTFYPRNRSKFRRSCSAAAATCLLPAVLSIPTIPAAAQSSGIAHSRPAGTAQWAISTRPIFAAATDVASRNSDILEVSGATRLANGTVVVGDNGDQSVKWFRSDGKFLRSFGRRGDGPGEFQLVRLLGRCGTDSLFVYDGASQRLTVVSTDGKFLADRKVTIDGSHPASPSAIECGWTPRFGVLGRPQGRVPQGDLPFRSQVPVVMQNISGVVVANAGVVQGAERQRFGTNVAPRPLGKQSTVAISRKWLYVGTRDSAYVNVFSTDGRAAPGVRLPLERRKLTKRDIDGFLDALIDANPRATPATIKELYGSLNYPEYLPAWGDMLTDALDCLWVQEYPTPGQKASRWLVFNDAHRQIAGLTIPADFSPLEIGTDWILGWRSDADGVKHLIAYSLNRAP